MITVVNEDIWVWQREKRENLQLEKRMKKMYFASLNMNNAGNKKPKQQVGSKKTWMAECWSCSYLNKTLASMIHWAHKLLSFCPSCCRPSGAQVLNLLIKYNECNLMDVETPNFAFRVWQCAALFCTGSTVFISKHFHGIQQCWAGVTLLCRIQRPSAVVGILYLMSFVSWRISASIYGFHASFFVCLLLAALEWSSAKGNVLLLEQIAVVSWG